MNARLAREKKMTGLQEVAPEELAKLFFHYREALAEDFGRTPVMQGRRDPHWENAPGDERRLLVASAKLVLLELANGHHGTQHEDPPCAPVHFNASEGRECGC